MPVGYILSAIHVESNKIDFTVSEFFYVIWGSIERDAKFFKDFVHFWRQLTLKRWCQNHAIGKKVCVSKYVIRVLGCRVEFDNAAIVDGAGPVRRFFSITLPLLTPIIFFNLINQVIGAFQAFNSSYLITKGKPLNTTLYYGVHLYNKAFNQFEMGYGSAMAWFMLLIIAFFTALIFRSSSAWVYYESEGR